MDAETTNDLQTAVLFPTEKKKKALFDSFILFQHSIINSTYMMSFF